MVNCRRKAELHFTSRDFLQYLFFQRMSHSLKSCHMSIGSTRRRWGCENAQTNPALAVSITQWTSCPLSFVLVSANRTAATFALKYRV